VAVYPATVASRTESADISDRSPALIYDMYLFSAGEFQLDIDCLPTRPISPDRGVRLAISIDDQEPQVLGQSTHIKADVLANLRRMTTRIAIDKHGQHTLTIWMVDPGVLIDKIVVYTDKPKDSYLGPPESCRQGG